MTSSRLRTQRLAARPRRLHFGKVQHMDVSGRADARRRSPAREVHARRSAHERDDLLDDWVDRVVAAILQGVLRQPQLRGDGEVSAVIALSAH